MKFTWIPFYMEFAKKLLKYRDDRTPLVNWIYDNIDRSLIKHFKDDSAGKRVPDTDPFTVMAIINRGITWEKKIAVCEQFKNFLGISADVPQDFSGVPEMNNQKSNFIAFEDKRKDGDIERLWNLFECAVLDKDIEDGYNALKNQYLIKFNITMGLFWIRPDKYLSFDGNNKAKLTSLGIASFDGRFVPYKEYKTIMERLDAKMASGEINCSNYAEFSHMAYKQNDGKNIKDWLEQGSVDYWMYSPGENASKWQECQDEGIMCIGWDNLGDLSKYDDREDIRNEIKKYYPSDGSAKNDTLAVWQFANEMKSGDIVYAKKGRNTIIGRGVVESDYLFDDDLSDYKHIRFVKWTDVGEWKTDDIHAMKTLTNITRYTDYVNKLNQLIDGVEGMASEQDVAYNASDDVNYWWLFANPNTWQIDTFNVGDIQEYTAYNEKGNKRQLFKYFSLVKPGDKLICYETSPTKRVKALCEITRELHEDDGYEIFNFIIKEKVAYQIPWNELIQNEVFKGSEPYRAATGSLYHLTKEEYDTIVDLVGGNETANPTTSDGKRYWWLVANPKIWSLYDIENGEEQNYSLYNDNGNPRRIFKYFQNAKEGDVVIGYESTPTKQIVSLLVVSKASNGKDIWFKKTETFASPINFTQLKNTPELESMEYMKNQQGSFFKLTKEEYEIIMEMVREENPLPKNEKKEKYTLNDFLNDVFIYKNDYERLKELLLRKQNLILQGAPGVGKTYAAKRLAYAIMGEKDEDRIKVVQFHQNYSYEDFVLGYKPNENGGFDLKDGIFYQFCRKAAADKDHKYFFIIDEINRGNLSKIFGELLMMIEKDYRDIPMQMSYADRRFSVPSNVYLIGMMNTADRSLAMIDYALRRRFSFFDMKPAFENPRFEEEIKKLKDNKLESLVKALIELNKVIVGDDSLGSGFCIGHSYLCDLKEGYDLESIVEYDIIPMLREYWFDNDDRLNREAQNLRKALND